MFMVQYAMAQQASLYLTALLMKKFLKQWYRASFLAFACFCWMRLRKKESSFRERWWSGQAI